MAAHAWDIAAGEVDVSKEIIAADKNRDELTVQLHLQTNISQDIVYLGFGEDAEDGKGIAIGGKGCSVTVLGAKARLAVNAICDAVVSGGIETYTSLEYRHTRDYPSWHDHEQNYPPKT